LGTEALLRLGIDKRDWRRDRETCRRSDGGGGPRRHLDDTVAEPDPGVGHRLGVNMTKMLPLPNIDNEKFEHTRPWQ
jgi:hypothetical protein